MSDTAQPPSAVAAMRTFVPAREIDLSRRFYEKLGFTSMPLGETLFQMALPDSPFAFLLQDFYVKDFAENLMVHLMVEDLDAWWRHIEGANLPGRFGVPAPRAPKLEPWGLRVAYVWDPAGVLWHIAARA